MPYKFLLVRLLELESGENELNAFLRSHRVLNVDRRWVDQGADSFWMFCVDYLDSGTVGSSRDDSRIQTPKKDYKEILSTEDFALFIKLRSWRKAISQSEAIPVYTVFTNEQLAQIVQRKVNSKSSLQEINGIGDARVQKYGARLLEFLSQQSGSDYETRWEPLPPNPHT
ncbi:MAG: HRDC domain-containing protein [Planctomycetaceae bacterium]|nr:HRDC domain-containing protein [Planctomycetaceae bacterium]